MTTPESYFPLGKMHSCMNSSCQRQAPKGIMFCCAPCADTWEGVSEPGAHLQECEVRTPKWIIQQEVVKLHDQEMAGEAKGTAPT